MDNELRIDHKKLIALRHKRRMSQAELALKAGITRETVNEIENCARTNFTFDTFNGLLKALDVTRDTLLAG